MFVNDSLVGLDRDSSESLSQECNITVYCTLPHDKGTVVVELPLLWELEFESWCEPVKVIASIPCPSPSVGLTTILEILY